MHSDTISLHRTGVLLGKMTFRQSALLVASANLSRMTPSWLRALHSHVDSSATLQTICYQSLFRSQASCVGLYGRCLSLMVCVLLSLACALGFLFYYSKESGSLRFPIARLQTLLFPSLPPLRLLPWDFQRESAACFSVTRQILKTCTQSTDTLASFKKNDWSQVKMRRWSTKLLQNQRKPDLVFC